MDDKLLQLAFGIYHGKGTYALLLGSGISRQAGIPTGWEVTRELIRELAIAQGKTITSTPEYWYQAEYGVEPQYDKVLEKLGDNQFDRSRLLRRFFEPTEEELEEGLKQPTEAHHAIAWLVKNGYIKIILTTNFDQLLENALRNLGVVPDVVKSDADFKSMMPIQHSNALIIKIHGDYRDWHIRNTKLELSNYPPEIDRCLDRIFSEYGVVICGWSGGFDVALERALTRTNFTTGAPIFGTYWAVHQGKLSSQASQIIEYRRANQISIKDADDFFKELKETVEALEHLSGNREISTAILVQRVKKLLVNNNYIELDELVRTQANQAYEVFASEEFNNRRAEIQKTQGQDAIEKEKQIWQLYFSSVEQVLHIVATIGWHGELRAIELVRLVIERFSETPPSQSLLAYRFIPSLLAIYAVGIPMAEKGKWKEIGIALKLPTIVKVGQTAYFKETDHISALTFIFDYLISQMYHRGTNFFKDATNSIPETLIGSEIYTIFSNYLPNFGTYERYFDLFEMVLSLLYIQLDQTRVTSVWLPIHKALFGRSKGFLIHFWQHEAQKSIFLDSGLLGNNNDEIVALLRRYQVYMKQFYDLPIEFSPYASIFEEALSKK